MDEEERDDFSHDFKNQSFKCKMFKLFELMIQLYEKIYNIFILSTLLVILKIGTNCAQTAIVLMFIAIG